MTTVGAAAGQISDDLRDRFEKAGFVPVQSALQGVIPSIVGTELGGEKEFWWNLPGASSAEEAMKAAEAILSQIGTKLS